MTRGHSDLAVAALAAAAALGLTAAVLARRRSNRAPAARRRIYVARHAQKQRNQPESDNLSLELSPEGREALGVLKEYLVANGITFATTYVSPFVRCRQTAEMLASGSIVEPGLSEVLHDDYGLRDGSGRAGTVQELRERLQQLSASDTTPLVALAELERDRDTQFMASMRRTATLVQRLLRKHRRASSYPLLLVGHGGSSFGVVQALQSGGQVGAAPPVPVPAPVHPGRPPRPPPPAPPLVPLLLRRRRHLRLTVTALLAAQVAPFDKRRMQEMASLVVLEEEQNSGHQPQGPPRWRVVGALQPERGVDGTWEVRWRAAPPARAAGAGEDDHLGGHAAHAEPPRGAAAPLAAAPPAAPVAVAAADTLTALAIPVGAAAAASAAAPPASIWARATVSPAAPRAAGPPGAAAPPSPSTPTKLPKPPSRLPGPPSRSPASSVASTSAASSPKVGRAAERRPSSLPRPPSSSYPSSVSSSAASSPKSMRGTPAHLRTATLLPRPVPVSSTTPPRLPPSATAARSAERDKPSAAATAAAARQAAATPPGAAAAAVVARHSQPKASGK